MRWLILLMLLSILALGPVRVQAQTPTATPQVVLTTTEEERRQDELIALGGGLGLAFLLIFAGAALHFYAGRR